MKVIFVTHVNYKEGPNPPITKEGEKDAEKLRGEIISELGKRAFYPKESIVASGTGKRQRQTAEIITKRNVELESEYLGVPEVSSLNKKKVIFPTGEEIPIEVYMSSPRFKSIVKNIPVFLSEQIIKARNNKKNLIIVGGRIVLLALGLDPKDIKMSKVYHLELTKEGKIKVEEFN